MASQVMSRAKNAVRTFNKYVLNPAMLLLAERTWWYAGVIRHTGRHTGRKYATPVVVNLVADATAAVALLSERRRREFDRFGIGQYVKLERVDDRKP